MTDKQSNPPQNAEFVRKAREVLRDFLILPHEEITVDLDAAIASAQPGVVKTASAFRDNIISTITVASLPYRMTMAAVQGRRFERLHIAERIRSLDIADPEAEVNDTLALMKARKRFAAEMNLPETAAENSNLVVAELHSANSNDGFRKSAAELLHQALAMTWSAFEVLVTDLLVDLINAEPALVVDLTMNETTKKYFPTRGVSYTVLAEHAFDLSKSMGEILFSELKFDRLNLLKDVLKAVFPQASELHLKLSGTSIWTLWQRRHLIVHRRGIVDASYLAKTSDNHPLGHHLGVSGKDVEDALKLVCESGCHLIEAASARLN